ncbi:MAG: hypothetical protein ACJAV7_002756, partial [Flavobacteriales bacterium]
MIEVLEGRKKPNHLVKKPSHQNPTSHGDFRESSCQMVVFLAFPT